MREPLKIGIACTSFDPEYGGPATVALQHARALADRGHEVTVFGCANDVTPNPVYRGIRSQLFPANTMGVLGRLARWRGRSKFPFVASKELRRWVRSNVADFDVVHVHFARERVAEMVARTSLRAGVPTVLQTHGMLDSRGAWQAVAEAVLKTSSALENAACVLTLHHAEANAVRRIAPNANLRELPNSVTIPKGQCVWRGQTSRDVTFAARLHPRKGGQALVYAAKLLAASGLKFRVRVVGPDEGDLAAIDALVKANGLEQIVSLEGPMSREATLDAIAESAVFVLPSRDEKFPMTVVESLAIGTPCVMTTDSYISGSLERHGAAITIVPEPREIAAAIRTVLESPPLAQQLSRAGRDYFSRYLTSESVISKLEDTYYASATKSG